MFSLNIKQLLDHHVFVPGKTLLPSPWELLYGFMEPFCRSIVIPLVDSHLCSFLTTIEPSYPVEHCCLQLLFLNKFRIIDEYLTVLTSSFHRSHVVHFC